ncbi:PREDICTED: 28S ribosomal protein S28, mitochondrial [Ceratosolen solmsi marchali]|uniref:28S ribosomal protein S28, mitochondrial n=1 Tax=Ceratosolen solmsi marchali TaxID=326594 RepID=A0AAJ6YFV2_9HYME|nr:PREDICTED: 28S ribosomal protein S28, mitochondrial [Ceratosolen solmsi marchali]
MHIEHISKKVINKQENTNNTYFASLLRFSKFIQLGNIEEKIVTGKIFQVVNNDLYIDFGWKFYCVCSNPMQNNSKFVRGATVYLQIKDLEISTRFLGSDVDTTILESDCILLGLIKENKLII